MRIAGLDIAKNTTGLAFSDDEMTFISNSFSIPTKLTSKLQFLYNQYKPDLSIIGLPSWGMNRDFIKSFVHNNRILLQPFIFIDEIYTTQLTDIFNKKLQKDECSARIFVHFCLENKDFLYNQIKHFHITLSNNI